MSFIYVLKNEKTGEKIKSKTLESGLTKAYTDKNNGAKWEVYKIRTKKGKKNEKGA